MKIKLPLFFIFTFLLVHEGKSQQCLTSGGCTIAGSQYPSGTFAPSSSWQVLKNGINDALMNAGNYTLFSVTAGNTYQWTYCETYGAVSTAWDAQLTLSNNSTPTIPICFSTDVCGNNSNAPYISWVATFTGTARILSTTYNGLSCQVNTCSCWNKLAYRQVGAGYNLTVTVHNAGGATMSNAKVVLYSSIWAPLQTLYTNGSGQVVFTALSNASYNFEVYYTPSGVNPPITPNEEFWGGGLTTINGSNLTISFTRHNPYISATTPFSPATVTSGQQTTGGYTVLNPLPYTMNSYVQIWVDRDQVSGWDYTSQASVQSISASGSFPFSFNVTPTNTGTYSKYAFVYSLINGNYILTDQYPWISAFTVNSACVTPGIPASAVGASTGQTTANLSWTAANPAGSPTVTYYWVVGTNSSVTYGSGIAQNTTTGTSASVTGLSCGTTYYLRVYAKTNCNNTSSSYITSSSFTTFNCSSQLLGIDVSHWQDTITWSLVYGSGIDFAYVKATEGNNNYFYTNYFTTNIIEAENVGLKTGAYHYAKPNLNSALSEANYFLSIASAYIGANHLPPALDIENPDAATYVSNNSITALETWIQTWMTTIQNATGVPPIIYVPATISPFTSFSNTLSASQLWIVNQNGNTNPPPNTGSFNTWVFKQYDQSLYGAIPGIPNAAVDLDVFNGDIIAFNNLISIPSILTDLTITANSLSVSPTTVNSGSYITASCSETNGNGLNSSSINEVGLWLSSNAILEPSIDDFLGEISGFPALSGGSTSSVLSNVVQIPIGKPSGTYYLFFWVDNNNEDVTESVEKNNFASVLLTINCSAPNASITAIGPTTFCAGGSVTLNTVVAANRSYQWKKNGNVIFGATLSSYTATASGSYKVTVTNTLTNCSKTTSVATIVAALSPTATITPQGPTTFCAGGSVVLQANTGTGLAYLWKRNGSTISGTLSSRTASTAGTYKVQVTDNSTGCSKLSTGVVVTVNCKESDENIINNVMEIHPNPTKGNVTIRFSSNVVQNCNLSVTDITGRVVMREQFTTTEGLNEHEVDLNNLSEGVYLVHIKKLEGEMIQRVVIE